MAHFDGDLYRLVRVIQVARFIVAVLDAAGRPLGGRIAPGLEVSMHHTVLRSPQSAPPGAATRAATLVVIEFSASWPRWLKPTRGGDMAVVAQHYEGHPSSLVTQVASRTTRLEAVGWRLDSIVLVSNGRTDPDSVASRSVLARGLAARLKVKERGELVLTVDERAGKRAIQNLRALAKALESSVRGCPVGLCVRVGEGAETIVSVPEADTVVSRAAG